MSSSVTDRIAITLFAELSLYGFWGPQGWFCRIVENSGVDRDGGRSAIMASNGKSSFMPVINEQQCGVGFFIPLLGDVFNPDYICMNV